MRFVTYIELALRRVWARRGILLGSFLGATLVTAILAIVPLYESSIAAVDLLFTVRRAPAVEVDLLASSRAGEYHASEAALLRAEVAEAGESLRAWYPVNGERTLSREIVFIPLDGLPDWLELAGAWRETAFEWRSQIATLLETEPNELGSPVPLARAIEVGHVPPEMLALLESAPEEVPALERAPYPQPAPEATVTRFLTAPDVLDAVELVEGGWPEDAVGSGPGPVPQMEIVIGEDLARFTGLEVGSETIIKPFATPLEVFEIVRVAGIARPVDPGASVWRAVNPEELILLPQDVFDHWVAPVPGDFKSDPWLRDQRGMPGLSASQTWHFPLDRETVVLENLSDVRNAVSVFSGQLGRTRGIAVSTALPALVERFDVRTTVFGAPILAMLALVVAGALYFLIYTASLILEREGPELALLRTRGASRVQTVGLHLVQSAAIALGAVAVGPLVARFLVGITGRLPPMSDLTGGASLRVSEAGSVVPFVLGGGALVFLSMGLAVLPVARRSVLDLRAQAARPTRTSIWQRYYIDVFLVVVAGLLLFELRQRGLVDKTEDGVSLDPFLIIAPALFLFAGALVLLRLLPGVLRVMGWGMTKLAGLRFALPGWHVGRNPIPYGRLALLIWLVTGFGAFALTYAQTLDRSYRDRAAFTTGADLRVIGEGAGFLDVPDGSRAAAVYRSQGAARLATSTAELLAVRPEDFSQVVTWRSDFGGGSPSEVFSLLRPDGTAPDWGVELPPGASALEIDAVQIPKLGREEREPLLFVARIADGKGRLWTFASAALSDESWQVLEIPLDAATAISGGSDRLIGPLVLQSVWLERRTSGGVPILQLDTVLVDSFDVVTPSGRTSLDGAIAEELEPHTGLELDTAPAGSAARAAESLSERSDGPVIDATPLERDGVATQWSVPLVRRIDPVPHLRRPPDELRVLLDADAGGTALIRIGDETLFGIDGDQIPGTRVGALGPVPTTGSSRNTGVMVVDLDALMPWLNGEPTWGLGGNPARLAAAEELWVATDDPERTGQALVAGFPSDSFEIVTTQGLITDFSSRPVQVGLVAILIVGAATGVVLALVGVTGYVLVAVQRRTREMGVLRALGFDRRGVTTTFALEQLVALAVGAVIGAATGVGLMRLMIPFLQLGESGEDIIPAALVEVPGGTLGAYLGVMAVLLGLSVVWATRRVSTRRLSEVLREGGH